MRISSKRTMLLLILNTNINAKYMSSSVVVAIAITVMKKFARSFELRLTSQRKATRDVENHQVTRMCVYALVSGPTNSFIY